MESQNKPQNNQSKNKEEEKSRDRSGINNYLKYAGMGVQMLAIIFIFTWVGIKIDEKSKGDTPLFTAILALVGVILAILTVIKDFIFHKNDS